VYSNHFSSGDTGRLGVSKFGSLLDLASVGDAVEHLPAPRTRIACVLDRYLDVNKIFWRPSSIAPNYANSPN
jgi:hypothetical protein